LNGAYGSFEEHIKGSLEVGKLADMIVLSDDILSVDPFTIHQMQVDLTMVDGEICYLRPEAQNSFS
jgi:predicted amidohydrolase YtcJ